MNVFHFRPLILLLVFMFIACSKDNHVAPAEEIVTTRSFYMGFTAFPYADTSEAFNETVSNVKNDGDLFLAHFDFGVPWDEVRNNESFPINVQAEIAVAQAQKSTDTKLILTTTALDQNREHLALYWNNEGTHQPLPTFWVDKTFNDPEVIQTYTDYCRRLIVAVQPDYFGYGIEANAVFQKEEASFIQYLELCASVYNTLKTEYPNLPIFLSVQDQSGSNTRAELLETTRMLLQYSDYVAMSTYPFLDYTDLTRDANPVLFSDTWLTDFRNLAPNKPFAVAETGFTAEDLAISGMGVDIKGSEAWQQQYVLKLMEQSNTLEAEFVAWFVYRDYDILYNNTPSPPDALKIWKDNGLLDGGGNPRASYTTWLEWLSLPKE